jgi:hypothetical protein
VGAGKGMLIENEALVVDAHGAPIARMVRVCPACMLWGEGEWRA